MSFQLHSLTETVSNTFSLQIAPARVRFWQGQPLALEANATHIGFVYQRRSHLYRQQGQQTYFLQSGMYFCLPGAGEVSGHDAIGIVISCPNYWGLFSVGGPIEPSGRFAYIDGGTSSLLIPPVSLGDPCLNALYFPPHCSQTLHTHPSYRIGLILEGAGACETPTEITALQPGKIFLIPPEQPHKFCTATQSLTLVVFHPDSDTGFNHQNNPMLNRTFVEGISATQIPKIHTPM
jgi:mannose-6-phosphate isomerase-like protein (cupin superfamily)